MKSAKEILTSTEKFHITLGLDRIKAILKLLGNPQKKYKVIHIAGTNGKGSTCKIINDFLINHYPNKKIGLYTSPHIFKYNERIKVNNVDISDGIFDNLIDNIDNLAKENKIELSEFELLSASAFYYFYIKKVDFVILETGLGGNFDATNVVDNPIITIITTLGFDHMERLGNTIEQIALQKAGIIKNNCPLVIDKNNLGYEVIKQIAKEKNASIVDVVEVKTYLEGKRNIAEIENEKYDFNLFGNYQSQNLALAYSAIKKIIPNIKKEEIEKTLKNVFWKYRLQYEQKQNLFIDCAHNPQGIQALKEFLNEAYFDCPKTYIFGCLKNKDHKKMMEILSQNGQNSKFYFYEFDYPNALKYDEIDEKYKNIFKKTSNPNEIIEKDKNLKIVAGSIYMLSKIFKD